MDLSFTGGLIIGASHYVFRLDLPKVTWLSASADVDGPGLIRHKVEGRLLGVTGAPEGMDGVTGPLAVYAVNRRATSPLA